MGAERHQPAGGGAVSHRVEWRQGALGVTGGFVRRRTALASIRRGELLALSPARRETILARLQAIGEQFEFTTCSDALAVLASTPQADVLPTKVDPARPAVAV